MRRAVHVAGRGAVTGFGAGRVALVEGIFAGRRALAPRRRTAVFRAPTEVAAEFPAGCFGADVVEDQLPLTAALCAGAEALAEARRSNPGLFDTNTVPLVLATTKADLSGFQTPGDGLGLPIRLAQRLAERLGLGVVLAAVSTACSSGLAALALAERRIALGEIERALVIGTDALNEFIMAGFGSMHILDPEPCRPFDQARRGLSLGDGAGAILLSAHAHESVGFRLAGHGGANDACHVTGCDREGRGLSLAVGRALAHAGLRPADVDLVHLHGTGTRANDSSESVALGTAFGGNTPPAFGTKAQTGHTLGASGVIESLLAMAALERAEVPANVGLEESNTDPRLQLTRAPTPLARARIALKVASGFGGMQQALLFQVEGRTQA